MVASPPNSLRRLRLPPRRLRLRSGHASKVPREGQPQCTGPDEDRALGVGRRIVTIVYVEHAALIGEVVGKQTCGPQPPAQIRMQIKLGIARQVRLARGSSGKGEVGRARSDV